MNYRAWPFGTWTTNQSNNSSPSTRQTSTKQACGNTKSHTSATRWTGTRCNRPLIGLQLIQQLQLTKNEKSEQALNNSHFKRTKKREIKKTHTHKDTDRIERVFAFRSRQQETRDTRIGKGIRDSSLLVASSSSPSRSRKP